MLKIPTLFAYEFFEFKKLCRKCQVAKSKIMAKHVSFYQS
jgi:hypothetical protein